MKRFLFLFTLAMTLSTQTCYANDIVNFFEKTSKAEIEARETYQAARGLLNILTLGNLWTEQEESDFEQATEQKKQNYEFFFGKQYSSEE